MLFSNHGGATYTLLSETARTTKLTVTAIGSSCWVKQPLGAVVSVSVQRTSACENVLRCRLERVEKNYRK